jgi:hypothetical protein
MSDNWTSDVESPAAQAARIVSGLLRLARDDEACRLLGVEGTLEDEVDVTFLADPLAWIANEIANAIAAEEDEEEVVSLSTLVALVRLYRILRGGDIDETELREAVVEYLSEEEEG